MNRSEAMPDKSIVREAAILAGGLGTRLRCVLPDQPKVLAPVAGRPFIAYLLDRLSAAGVERTVLLTGYKSGTVEKALGRAHRGMALAYSREESALDTAGAIRLALPLFAGPAILALNGDSFLDIDLNGFIGWFERTGPVAALAAAYVDDASRFGGLRLDAGGAVLGFAEKSTSGPGRINAGVYLLSRAVLESIPPGRPVSLEREIFPGLIGRGLTAYPCQGNFLDIGTPQSYSLAERFFAERPARS